MNTAESTVAPTDARQSVASGIASYVEHLNHHEMNALVAREKLALANEIVALNARIAAMRMEPARNAAEIEKLEARKVRLHYQVGRLSNNKEEWDKFDPAEYTVPIEEMLENARKRLQKTT